MQQLIQLILLVYFQGASCQINHPGGDVYAEASFSAAIISHISAGIYEIAGRTADNQWFLLKESGWVLSGRMSSSPACGEVMVFPVVGSVPLPTEGACVLSGLNRYANIHEEPSNTARDIGDLSNQDIHPVLGMLADGAWYQIEAGWVSAQVIRLGGNCGLYESAAYCGVMSQVFYPRQWFVRAGVPAFIRYCADSN